MKIIDILLKRFPSESEMHELQALINDIPEQMSVSMKSIESFSHSIQQIETLEDAKTRMAILDQQREEISQLMSSNHCLKESNAAFSKRHDQFGGEKLSDVNAMLSLMVNIIDNESLDESVRVKALKMTNAFFENVNEGLVKSSLHNQLIETALTKQMDPLEYDAYEPIAAIQLAVEIKDINSASWANLADAMHRNLEHSPAIHPAVKGAMLAAEHQGFHISDVIFKKIEPTAIGESPRDAIGNIIVSKTTELGAEKHVTISPSNIIEHNSEDGCVIASPDTSNIVIEFDPSAIAAKLDSVMTDNVALKHQAEKARLDVIFKAIDMLEVSKEDTHFNRMMTQHLHSMSGINTECEPEYYEYETLKRSF